jgi:hypothetical protein
MQNLFPSVINQTLNAPHRSRNEETMKVSKVRVIYLFFVFLHSKGYRSISKRIERLKWTQKIGQGLNLFIKLYLVILITSSIPAIS